MQAWRAIKVSVAAAVSLTALPGCGASDVSDGELIVFAASSLTDVFDEIAAEFEAANPGTDVVVNAQGSAQLAAQIEQGAPADVFAAADTATMERVLDDVVGEPVTFVRNTLVIAVSEGNPLGIRGVTDLVDADLTVVVAAPEVPAGAYAAQAFAAAGVVVDADSYEQNVRSVAAKVALGEADAGIVYRTDVAAADDRLDAVEIAVELSIEYPIVAVSDDELAGPFIEFVLGPRGRAIVTAAGFEAP